MLTLSILVKRRDLWVLSVPLPLRFLFATGSARRVAGQPGGRGGRDPGLADSALGVFEMPIPQTV